MTGYHAAPVSLRAKIERHGLLPQPATGEAYIGPRTWMSPSLEASRRRLHYYRQNAERGGFEPEAHDVWEIDLTGIALRDDLHFGNGDQVTNDPIPPDHLTRIQ